MVQFHPYQRRKSPLRALYTHQKRPPAPDENESTPSEFEVVNQDDVEDAPSKFEVYVISPWKDFVTNSPTVAWIATYMFSQGVRSEVYKILDRLLDEQTVPEIRKIAGLDGGRRSPSPSESDSEFEESEESDIGFSVVEDLPRTPPRLLHEQGFEKDSDFIFSLERRWSSFLDGEGRCACGIGLVSFVPLIATGFYHLFVYLEPEPPPSAIPHFLVCWCTVFAINAVVSSIAICQVYTQMEEPIYAVEWPIKIRPKSLQGFWWGVDLLHLPSFWSAWSLLLFLAGMIFLPIGEWLLSISRPDTPEPQSTDPIPLNIIASILNRWLMYLCVASNLAHAVYTLNTLGDDLRDMRNSWERRKDRMKAGEDPFTSCEVTRT